ncbi:MAG: hypothetical protein KAR38_06275 [Calditrichia bacterium]|nr:hypothetical protein [Calditrichia bacterium]
MKNKKNKKLPVLLSILVHLILLLSLPQLLMFFKSNKEKPVEPLPVVLEFENPEIKSSPIKDIIPPEAKFFEVVENKNANETTPDKSSLLAAKSSTSASLKKKDNLNNRHFSKKTQESGNNNENEKQLAINDNISNHKGDYKIWDYHIKNQFSKEYLLKEEPENLFKKTQDSESEQNYELKEFSGESVGKFKLSTYEWEWAPWMLAFQKKLYRMWSAPPAWQIGLIYGYTDALLIITKNGKLLKYEVLDHTGHLSLKTSSVNALESIFPFQELPPEFPDEYLELRIRLVYPELKKIAKNYTRRKK